MSEEKTEKQEKAKEILKNAVQKEPEKKAAEVKESKPKPEKKAVDIDLDALRAEIKADIMKELEIKHPEIKDDQEQNYKLFADLYFMKIDFIKNPESEKNKMKQKAEEALDKLTKWAEPLKKNKLKARKTTTAYLHGYGHLKLIEGYGVPEELENQLKESSSKAFEYWFV